VARGEPVGRDLARSALLALALAGCDEPVTPAPPSDPCEELAARGKEVVSLEAAGGVTMALLADGTAVCWGHDYMTGQCARPVELTSYQEPVIASGISCAIEVKLTREGGAFRSARGDVWVWSTNAGGQLEATEHPEAPPGVPTRVREFQNALDVDCGGRGVAVIDEQSRTWWWGHLWTLQPIPRPIQDMPDAVQVDIGGEHACGVTGSGEVWCIGSNRFGNLGNGMVQQEVQQTATRVIDLPEAKQVSAQGTWTCALTTSGQVWCWGQDLATLGRGTGWSATPPTMPLPQPTLPIPTVRDLVSGSCAITQDDDLYCWGSNAYRQLDPGSDQSVAAPRLIAEAKKVSKVAVGDGHVCVLRTDGTVWCAGDPLSLGSVPSGPDDTEWRQVALP
jgi:alpha-tubulin suppressor-like RCC1 family protein